MITELKRIISEDLPSLILDRSRWNAVVTCVRKPTLARLYTIIGKNRLSLHFTTDPDFTGEDSVFHIHAWPMAATVLEGRYSMELGRTKHLEDTNPEKVSTLEINSGCFYDMPDVFTWHRVVSITPQCFSIMLNGQHWDPMPKFLSSGKEYLRVMTESEKTWQFKEFERLLGIL